MAGRDAEPPVQEVSPKSHPPRKAPRRLLRVMLYVPGELVWFVSGLLAARRREIGTGRDPEAQPLPAGTVRPGVVPRQAGHPPARRSVRPVPGHRLRVLDEVTGVLAERAVRAGRDRAGPGLSNPLNLDDALADAGTASSPAAATPDWAQHEVTARVLGDCRIVMFGIFLARSGRIELREPELARGT